jgi:hypothetical protein
MTRSFYTVVLTPDTWQVFLALEKKSIGFRLTLSKRVAKLRPGDILICYLAKAMAWSGALEVNSTLYENKAHVYSKDHGFPILIDVEPVVLLKNSEQILVKSPTIWCELERFRNVDHQKNGWAVTAGLLCSLRSLSEQDATTLLNAMRASVLLQNESD